MGWNSWLWHGIISNLENTSIQTRRGNGRGVGREMMYLFHFCLADSAVLQRNPPPLELKFWKVSVTFHMYSVSSHENIQKGRHSKMLSSWCNYEPNTHLKNTQHSKKKKQQRGLLRLCPGGTKPSAHLDAGYLTEHKCEGQTDTSEQC